MICSMDTNTVLLQSNKTVNANDCQTHTYTTRTMKRPIFQVNFKVFQTNGTGYLLVTVRDVSMFNHIEILRTINSNKSKMLSQVAHEFRTPLGSIILFLKTLVNYLDEDVKTRYGSYHIKIRRAQHLFG